MPDRHRSEFGGGRDMPLLPGYFPAFCAFPSEKSSRATRASSYLDTWLFLALGLNAIMCFSRVFFDLVYDGDVMKKEE